MHVTAHVSGSITVLIKQYDKRHKWDAHNVITTSVQSYCASAYARVQASRFFIKTFYHWEIDIRHLSNIQNPSIYKHAKQGLKTLFKMPNPVGFIAFSWLNPGFLKGSP